MDKNDRLADKFVREVTEQYRDIETKLIYEIVEIIKGEKDLDKLVELIQNYGVMNERIIEVIAELSGEPLDKIVKHIKTLSVNEIDTPTLNKAYELGLVPIKFDNNALKPIVDFNANLIRKDIRYISQQVKLGAYRDTYIALRNAQVSVELGLTTPNKAIANAVRDLSKKGITGDTFLRNGVEVRQNLESVVRRAVRTSFTNTMADSNAKLGEELDIDTWYMSQHLGARTTGTGLTNHAEWQGKIYTTEELTTVCGMHEPQGYLGYNCRHIARVHIEGVSVKTPPLLDMEELERVYALEQKQRAYERSIRESKRIIQSLKILETEESEELIQKENNLLKQRQRRLREYIKENDDVLRRDYIRENIYERV